LRCDELQAGAEIVGKQEMVLQQKKVRVNVKETEGDGAVIQRGESKGHGPDLSSLGLTAMAGIDILKD